MYNIPFQAIDWSTIEKPSTKAKQAHHFGKLYCLMDCGCALLNTAPVTLPIIGAIRAISYIASKVSL